jgi:SpoVK/Ycf46/Vps4 family AAA+-type ATPase
VTCAWCRPHELDDAARRRFVRKLYIPLPSLAARIDLVTRLLSTNRHSLTEEDIADVARRSSGMCVCSTRGWVALIESTGFSGADIHNLCMEAAMGPVRQLASVAHASIASLDQTAVRLWRGVHANFTGVTDMGELN